jgi:hypothetical protein
MQGFPIYGQIYAAYKIISALATDPPEAWAIARVQFAGPGDTSIAVDVQ